MTDQHENTYRGENLTDTEKEISQPSLKPYKVGFLAVFAARGVMVSFFPLYLKQLGLNPASIGIVMFFRSVGGFVGGALTPFLKSKAITQVSLLVLYAGILLVSGFAMEFLSVPILETFCAAPNNYSVFNISTGFNRRDNLADFSWMYAEGVQHLVILASVVMFLSELSGFGIDAIQHSITMVVLGKRSQDYGFLRAWGAFGCTMASVPTGLLLWLTQEKVKICAKVYGIVKYHLISYVFMGFSFVLLLNAHFIPEESGTKMQNDDFSKNPKDETSHGEEIDCFPKEEHKNSNKDISSSSSENRTSSAGRKLLALCCSGNILPWLFVLWARSMFCAVTQGFLNWYMESLGADPLLIGVSNGVTTTTEFFMFFLTPFIIPMFGHACLVSFGIVSYVIRLLLLSLVIDPNLIIPLEILEGVMFAILWSSLMSYLSIQVSEDRQSHLQGLVLCVKVIGKSMGYLLSGYLTELFGARVMFQIFAAIASFVSMVFISTQVVQSKWRLVKYLWGYKKHCVPAR